MAPLILRKSYNVFNLIKPKVLNLVYILRFKFKYGCLSIVGTIVVTNSSELTK